MQSAYKSRIYPDATQEDAVGRTEGENPRWLAASTDDRRASTCTAPFLKPLLVKAVVPNLASAGED